MNKKEAQGLIGKPVRVWTSANGEYVGTLKELLPTSPWRGRVEITGVLKPAQHYELGAVRRRGFRPGEVIEAGNSSISATADIGTDYKTALEKSIAEGKERAAKLANSPSIWATICFYRAEEIILQEEIKRLESGQWTFKGCHLPPLPEAEQAPSPIKKSTGPGL
jgi:hypothetical protein